MWEFKSQKSVRSDGVGGGGGGDGSGPPHPLLLHLPLTCLGGLYLLHEMPVTNWYRTAKDCIGNNKFNNHTSLSFAVLAYCLLILSQRKLEGFLTSNSNHALCLIKQALLFRRSYERFFLIEYRIHWCLSLRIQPSLLASRTSVPSIVERGKMAVFGTYWSI